MTQKHGSLEVSVMATTRVLVSTADAVEQHRELNSCCILLRERWKRQIMFLLLLSFENKIMENESLSTICLR